MKKMRMFARLGVVLFLPICLAMAWSPGSTVKYYACVNQADGAIRMVQQGATCNANEDLIEWNQVGPQGPPGEQGPPGVLRFYLISSEKCTIDAATRGSCSAFCNDGDAATGGTFHLACPHCDLDFRYEGGNVWTQGGTGMPVGWKVTIRNNHELSGLDLYAHVICADLTP